MARYIDADKLKPKTEWWREMDDYDHEREYCRSYYPLSEIENAPTEDVTPIIHAHWIVREPTEEFIAEYYECSHCHYEDVLKENYCPECGAERREE